MKYLAILHLGQFTHAIELIEPKYEIKIPQPVMVSMEPAGVDVNLAVPIMRYWNFVIRKREEPRPDGIQILNYDYVGEN